MTIRLWKSGIWKHKHKRKGPKNKFWISLPRTHFPQGESILRKLLKRLFCERYTTFIPSISTKNFIVSINFMLNIPNLCYRLHFGVDMLFLIFLPKVLFDLDPHPNKKREITRFLKEFTHQRVESAFWLDGYHFLN